MYVSVYTVLIIICPGYTGCTRTAANYLQQSWTESGQVQLPGIPGIPENKTKYCFF